MPQTKSVVINFKGGIVSPGYLMKVLDIADSVRVSYVRFSLSQQLIMKVPLQKFDGFSRMCVEKQVSFYEAGDVKPNIASAYGAAGIFSQESWLSEGVYKDVFDLFNWQPALKVNICDSKQNLAPFFTGHLNWLSSAHTHFWYLYIRFPLSSKLYCWPELVYTNDIANVSAGLEQLITANKSLYEGEQANGEVLYSTARLSLVYSSKPVTAPLQLPVFRLPYYEGFNKEGEAYWLGIYRRKEQFPVEFLKDVCMLCLETRIGQFYTTPWKSIIVKGIKDEHRERWNRILDKYRINVRHAANELNWQVEDNHEDGLIIKRHVIRYFDKEDVRTYGLSFAVKTDPFSSLFGSVIISKQQREQAGRLKSMDLFDILYTRDFNPNSADHVVFRKAVTKEQIGTYLVSLCRYFYEKESRAAVFPDTRHVPDVLAIPDKAYVKLLHQCRHCFSVYDEQYGDAAHNIPAGTPFHELPVWYTCLLCDTGKEEFISVEEKTLMYPG